MPAFVAFRGGWPSTTLWKSQRVSPINRFESHAFSYGGKLYVMGGWADNLFNSTKRVDVYDPAKNEWKRLGDMQAPETHAGMAVDVENGLVYFVAGHRGRYPSTPTNEAWVYKIATDTWVRLAASLPYNMGANSCAIVDGQLHSFGGDYADRYTNTPDHFVLDLARVRAGFTKAAPLPAARDHLSSVVLDGSIYVFGGEFGHDKYHIQQKVLQRYDARRDRWVRLPDSPVAKSHAESSSFVLNGRIIFAGGQVSPQKPSSSVYQYDPATNQWNTLNSLPTPRQGVAVQKVGDYFIITTGGVATNSPQHTTWTVKVP